MSYSIIEQSDCVTYLMFEDVPMAKIPQVKKNSNNKHNSSNNTVLPS